MTWPPAADEKPHQVGLGLTGKCVGTVAVIRKGEPTKTFALDRTLLVATDARCYFRTDDGGQGLCHPNVKVGDQLWVLHGSNVPFVLRRAVLSDEEQAELRPRDAYGIDEDNSFGLNLNFVDDRRPYKHYYLIGDCYLDGLMDGEAAEGTDFVVLV